MKWLIEKLRRLFSVGDKRATFGRDAHYMDVDVAKFQVSETTDFTDMFKNTKYYEIKS